MDNTLFHTLADAALEALENQLEDAGVEAELLNGILTITCEDDLEVVVNKHMPSSEIWLASPRTGAARFAYTDGAWRHVVTQEVLEDVIKRETKPL